MMPDAVARIVSKCRAGTRMRLAFADPDCAHVLERDNLEQMGGTLPGRIRNALNFVGALQEVSRADPADRRPISERGELMSKRRDYYHDPNAPKANSLVPGGSALITDQHGRILMQRRADSGNWALPGGVMDIGETLEQCVIREVKEETGLDIEITGLLGIYTDPRHVIAYADGEVRQEFNITFYGRILGGTLTASDESTDVRFVGPEELETMPVHDTVRLRLQHHAEQRAQPYLG